MKPKLFFKKPFSSKKSPGLFTINIHYVLVLATCVLFINSFRGAAQNTSPSLPPGNGAATSRNIPVTGNVLSATGEKLAGATITVKGGPGVARSDENGNFQLTVAGNAELLVSYVGFETQTIPVGGRSRIDIVLSTGGKGLDEVVVVGYGTQRKQTVTGSVASVRGDQLTVAPVASTANTLAGRLPGLISKQSGGMPGFDAAALSIRGFGNALVIVDGFEQNFNNIDANEIESISILKDGSASIYGARAGNGVILVTTKRGNNGKPLITLNTTVTGQGVTKMLRPASAGQYTEMESEAWLQAGRPAGQVPYTQEVIQKYYAGTDPRFPNTDWYNELTRDWAPSQQHNLSVRGGSDRIRYYGFLGYLDQKTMWKTGGGDYKRYNFKSNIDAQILDNLSLQLDIGSIVENRDFPLRMANGGVNGIWQDFWTTRPIYPASLPDPTKYSYANGAGVGGVHLTSNKDIAGYSRGEYQISTGSLALNYMFKPIPGLSARAFVNYSQAYNTGKSFTKPFNFYTYDVDSKVYTLAGASGSKASLDITKNQDRIINTQLSMSYNHTFEGDHQVTALALYETNDYRSEYLSAGRTQFVSATIEQLFAGSQNSMSNNGSASEMGRKSVVGRFNYSYRRKYLLESSLRADASAKFPSEKRWGYFPSISVGWRLTEEKFMQNIGGLDELKLRASYGASGNDAVGNFQYLTGYSLSGNYVFGTAEVPALASTGLANPNLTWEQISIYNGGLDFSFANRKLYGEADVFYRKRVGIPARRVSSLPSTFGANLPPENLNSLNDRGFELRLGTVGNRGKFSYDISTNISWSRAKWDHFEEPAYTDADQERIFKTSGEWTDRQYGYLSDGLFTSQKQIDDLNFDQDLQKNKTLRPGDIRYKDVNGDAKLDWKDQVEIGKGTMPHWMLGFNINLRYKNFYTSSLWQGAMGYYSNIILTYKVGNLMRPSVIYDLRWSEKNNVPDALEPRLGGAVTNDFTSDYRYKNAGYLRLKVFSLGYDLPATWLEKVNFRQVKIYVAGTNLLTFDKLKKYGIDPEAPSGQMGSTFYYPQQRTISFGATISL
ncbi:MAG: SusC/RagA family TonB-linked outer membrane protein [Segetibacter sp.]|nr:SusC/RagA family TonB-linked outer membrane protein [Segetibacter sp.]